MPPVTDSTEPPSKAILPAPQASAQQAPADQTVPQAPADTPGSDVTWVVPTDETEAPEVPEDPEIPDAHQGSFESPESEQEPVIPLAPGPVIPQAPNSTSKQEASKTEPPSTVHGSDVSEDDLDKDKSGGASSPDGDGESYTDVVADSTGEDSEPDTAGHLLETSHVLGRSAVLGSSHEAAGGYRAMPVLPSRYSPTPLSPKSKLGKVLEQATEDVERLMNGEPQRAAPTPRQGTQARHTGETETTKTITETAPSSTTAIGGNGSTLALPEVQDDVTKPSQIGEMSAAADSAADSARSFSSLQSTLSTHLAAADDAKASWAEAQAALDAAEHALDSLPDEKRAEFRPNEDTAVPIAQHQPERAAAEAQPSAAMQAALQRGGWAPKDMQAPATLLEADKSQVPRRHTVFDPDAINTRLRSQRAAEVRAKAAAAEAEWQRAKAEEEAFVQMKA